MMSDFMNNCKICNKKIDFCESVCDDVECIDKYKEYEMIIEIVLKEQEVKINKFKEVYFCKEYFK